MSNFFNILKKNYYLSDYGFIFLLVNYFIIFLSLFSTFFLFLFFWGISYFIRNGCIFCPQENYYSIPVINPDPIPFYKQIFISLTSDISFGFLLGALICLFLTIKVTVYGIFKDNFVRGFLLNLDVESELKRYLETLSNSLKIPFPDSIVILFDAEIFVLEGSLNTQNGKAFGKILAIGLPVFSLLNVQELKAILFHELGHFKENDVIFFKYFKPIHFTTTELIKKIDFYINKLNKSEYRKTTLQIQKFTLKIYLNLFEKKMFKYIREKEYRADSIAVNYSNHLDFSNALKKIVIYPKFFNSFLKNNFLEENVNNAKINIFEEFRKQIPDLESEYEKKLFEESLVKETGKETHPVLYDRLNKLPEKEKTEEHDFRQSTTLFKDIIEYEFFLSNKYLKHLTIIKALKDYKPPTISYGTLGERSFAFILDFLLIYTFIGYLVYGYVLQTSNDFILINIYIFIILIFYFSIFEYSRLHASLAKKGLNLEITKINNSPIKLYEIIIRNLIKLIPFFFILVQLIKFFQGEDNKVFLNLFYISIIYLFLNFLYISRNKNFQTFHDKLFKICVIKKKGTNNNDTKNH
jgi:Zn-dependent protease with chaperone function/uncharacterized RDD family membrane protein YckC